MKERELLATRVIKAALLNDAASTDEEMVRYFRMAVGLTKDCFLEIVDLRYRFQTLGSGDPEPELPELRFALSEEEEELINEAAFGKIKEA